MSRVVFSSMLMLGFTNLLAVLFYMNQTITSSITCIIIPILLYGLVYITGFNPQTSITKTFWFVLIVNLIIVSSTIAFHYIPFTRRLLFGVSSKKWMEIEKKYERLLR